MTCVMSKLWECSHFILVWIVLRITYLLKVVKFYVISDSPFQELRLILEIPTSNHVKLLKIQTSVFQAQFQYLSTHPTKYNMCPHFILVWIVLETKSNAWFSKFQLQIMGSYWRYELLFFRHNNPKGSLFWIPTNKDNNNGPWMETETVYAWLPWNHDVLRSNESITYCDLLPGKIRLWRF